MQCRCEGVRGQQNSRAAGGDTLMIHAVRSTQNPWRQYNPTGTPVSLCPQEAVHTSMLLTLTQAHLCQQLLTPQLLTDELTPALMC